MEILIVTLVSVLVVVPILIWELVALGFVFQKAGISIWKAWVPVYNLWTFLRLGGKSGFWAVFVAAGLFVAGVVPALVTAIATAVAMSSTSYDAYSAAATVSLVFSILFGIIYYAVLIVYLVMWALAIHGINRGFRLSGGYTAVGIFFFPVWLSIIAWGPAVWSGLPEAQPETEAPEAPPAPVASSFILTPATPSGTAHETAPEAGIAPPPPAPPAVPDSYAGVANPFAPPGSLRNSPPPPPPARPLTPPPAPTRRIDSVPTREEVAAAPPKPLDDAVFAPQYSRKSAPSVPPVQEDFDGDDENDRTLMARPKASWIITAPDGREISVSGTVVILGRKPVADSDGPGAELVSLPDTTRTMSKSHARLTRTGSAWTITDLGSMNGVTVIARSGAETVVTPGVPTPVDDGFMLGEARVSIRSAG